MAINVVFYSFSKKDNSTKQPTSGGTTLSCEIKNQSSILTPYLIINTAITNPSNLNYAYIAAYGRYYWVTDWSWDRGFWYCNLTVDVLATYKTQIGSSTQYITRSAAASNSAIIDTKYPTLANPTAEEQFLSQIIGPAMKNTQGGYILGTISDNTDNGICYNLMGYDEFQDFLEYMFTGGYLSASDISLDLQKELINPFQYIASCMWFPFLDGSAHHYGGTVKFGFWDSNISCTPINEGNRVYSVMEPITLHTHPQAASRGKFLNNSPFTRRSIEVFGFGTIPLDPSYFVESQSCSVMIKVDKFTGVGELTVESAGATVLRTNAQVGVPIQISQVTQSVMAPAIAAVGAIGNIAAGNYLGAVSGVGNAIQSAMPQVQSTGSTGSKIDFIREPRITSQYYSLADEAISELGRPLCSQRAINTLSGYIQCENVELDLIATRDEMTAIRGYLEGGFFYE